MVVAAPLTDGDTPKLTNPGKPVAPDSGPMTGSSLGCHLFLLAPQACDYLKDR